MLPFSAAERHKNVATAEGRGKHLSPEPKPRQGRKTAALEKSFAPAGAMSGCECKRDSAQPSKIGFAQTETTAFSRGYILTPLRGSFRLIPNSSRSGVLKLNQLASPDKLPDRTGFLEQCMLWNTVPIHDELVVNSLRQSRTAGSMAVKLGF